jgi:hypothetical protein
LKPKIPGCISGQTGNVTENQKFFPNFLFSKELKILSDQEKKQVGKGVWLARNQTHESIETTPLNSAVFPIDSSKNRRE